MGGMWVTGEAAAARAIACEGPAAESTASVMDGKSIHDLPYMSQERFEAYQLQLKQQGVLIWRLPVIKGHPGFD